MGFPGEGNGNPLQCSWLENPGDEGAWWAAVYGVTQSWTRLKRLNSSSSSMGFPGGPDDKESACNARNPGWIPRLGRPPWRREWLSTSEFLPGESHGQRSLVGYRPSGCKHDWATNIFTFSNTQLTGNSWLFDTAEPFIPFQWKKVMSFRVCVYIYIFIIYKYII